MMGARPERDHYGEKGITPRVLEALRATRGDLEGLTAAELAAVDAFHVRGRKATAELAELLCASGPLEDARVLDVGSGPGGSARFLASEYGCRTRSTSRTRVIAASCQVRRSLRSPMSSSTSWFGSMSMRISAADCSSVSSSPQRTHWTPRACQ